MALETRRAIAVAINAEIRRSKARLLEDIPKLQRLAFKKVYLHNSVNSSYPFDMSMVNGSIIRKMLCLKHLKISRDLVS